MFKYLSQVMSDIYLFSLGPRTVTQSMQKPTNLLKFSTNMFLANNQLCVLLKYNIYLLFVSASQHRQLITYLDGHKGLIWYNKKVLK